MIFTKKFRETVSVADETKLEVAKTSAGVETTGLKHDLSKPRGQW